MAHESDSVAIAAISLASAEIFRAYRETAPSLEEIRCASPGDYHYQQLILDADMLSGIMLAMIGGSIALITGRIYPLVFGAIGLTAVSLYYRSVLKSTNLGMRLDNGR